jgi:hypothetical protein
MPGSVAIMVIAGLSAMTVMMMYGIAMPNLPPRIPEPAPTSTLLL